MGAGVGAVALVILALADVPVHRSAFLSFRLALVALALPLLGVVAVSVLVVIPLRECKGPKYKWERPKHCPRERR